MNYLNHGMKWNLTIRIKLRICQGLLNPMWHYEYYRNENETISIQKLLVIFSERQSLHQAQLG